MQIRVKTKPWGQKRQSVELRNRFVSSHTSGEGFRKKICFIEGSQKHVVSVTLNGRSLKQLGFFLELVSWPNWAIDREGLWLECWPRSWCHYSWAPWSYVEIGEIYRRTNTTATLHRSGLYGGVAKLNPLLSEDKRKHLDIYKKAPKGPSDSEKQDSLIWWTSILSIMFEGKPLCSSPAEYHPKSKVCL